MDLRGGFAGGWRGVAARAVSRFTDACFAGVFFEVPGFAVRAARFVVLPVMCAPVR